MTEKPTFDPARSEAMRRMLVETVAAEQNSPGSPAATRAPRSGTAKRRRVGWIAAIALLAGLVGSGTAALALNGQAWFGSAAPEPTVAAPSSPGPTPTPASVTPTPAPPTPSARANPPAPIIRVPATCEELAPVAESEAVLETTLSVAPDPAALINPVSYTDRRLGALTCAWNGPTRPEGSPSGVFVGIFPEVTAEQYEETTTGIDWGGSTPEDAIAPGAIARCGSVLAYQCSYLSRVGDYGIVLYMGNPPQTDLTDDQRAGVKAVFAEVVSRVRGFPAPEPLWQPDGPTLRGADDCAGLASDSELGELFDAITVSAFRSDDGENDSSLFHAGTTVGAYWCRWGLDPQLTVSATASVLPGGASYFAEYRAGSSLDWTAAPEYPGEAYLAADGVETYLTILIGGGWVELSVPTDTAADTLPGFADAVLANVGAR